MVNTKKCCLALDRIPENFEGILTIEVGELPVSTSLVFELKKPGSSPRFFRSSASAVGVADITITTTDRAYFSSQYEFFTMKVTNATTGEPVNLVHDGAVYSCFAVQFSPTDCENTITNISPQVFINPCLCQ